MTSWWRRQRLAVLLLPIIVVGASAASGMYVNEYWWKRGFHDAVPVSAQGWATISDEYDDGFVKYPIRAKVRLEGLDKVTELPGAFKPAVLPTGAALWEVRLAWDAAPDVSLFGCQVALFDRAGARYDAGVLGFDAGAPTPIRDCVPDETPGPQPQVGTKRPPQVAAGEDPRPQRYSTRVYVADGRGRPAGVGARLVVPAALCRAADG